jgi:hypothetical protein
MQQPETTLIYWAPSRVRFNLTLILAAAVILFGLYQLFMDARSSDDVPTESAAQTQGPGEGEGEKPASSGGGGGAWLLIVVGLGVGAYSWLTSPRQYRVYSDALIIMFGTPRRRTIHFSDIREVVNDRGFMGDPLRVYTVNRRRIALQVREPEEMLRYLDSALADFRRANPQYAPPPDPDPEDQPPDAAIVDSAVADASDPAPPSTEAAASEAAEEPAAPAPDTAPETAPDTAPERSPRSRRRSLRDDASADGDNGTRPRDG